mmetsp:Transcript_755/g.2638  ORF Transcript_755/g.2638 Transcript_755/m.2638 type:complete len:424 (+) Transcript_755:712-1983(+)
MTSSLLQSLRRPALRLSSYPSASAPPSRSLEWRRAMPEGSLASSSPARGGDGTRARWRPGEAAARGDVAGYVSPAPPLPFRQVSAAPTAPSTRPPRLRLLDLRSAARSSSVGAACVGMIPSSSSMIPSSSSSSSPAPRSLVLRALIVRSTGVPAGRPPRSTILFFIPPSSSSSASSSSLLARFLPPRLTLPPLLPVPLLPVPVLPVPASASSSAAAFSASWPRAFHAASGSSKAYASRSVSASASSKARCAGRPGGLFREGGLFCEGGSGGRFAGDRTLGAPDGVRSMLLRRGEPAAGERDPVRGGCAGIRGMAACARVGPGGLYLPAAMSSRSLLIEVPPIFCPCSSANRLMSFLNFASPTAYFSRASSTQYSSSPLSNASNTLSMSDLDAFSSALPVLEGKSSSTIAANSAGESSERTHTA